VFQNDLSARAAEAAAHLTRILAPMGDQPVIEAMRYGLRGGKGLRAYLVLEGAALHDVDPARAIWPAAAIEAMHAYSLIHDDLPAMDDDDLRRGQPTVHVTWDDATAILAGDALQSLAFELALDPRGAQSAEARTELGLTLAQAAGARGMVLGQALDIAAETADRALTLDEITRLQNGKTGALIAWSATAGPRMARAKTEALQLYAEALGLAFQIADDILDVEGDEKTAGKRLQKDAGAGKATFVSLLGLAGAKARAAELTDAACDALSPYGKGADGLREAARFVISRQS